MTLPPAPPPGPEPQSPPEPSLLEPPEVLVDARKALRRGLLGAALTLLVLALLGGIAASSPVGEAAVRDLLRRARPLPILAAMALMSCAFAFLGLRWRSLMPPPHRPPPLGLTALISAGLLLNYAVPGPFGELAAAWFAGRRYGVPLAEALASGVAARLVGLATAALLAAAAWVILEPPLPSDLQGFDQALQVAVALIGLGGLALLTLALRPSWWKALSAGSLGRLRGPGRLAAAARRADAGVGALADALERVARRGPRPYAAAAIWSLLAHGSVIAGIAIGVAGIGAVPALGGLIFTYATSTAGAVLLFALPGSQVGWDALFFGLLVATAELSPPDAAAIALLVRLQQLALMGLGGISLAWLLRRVTT